MNTNKCVLINAFIQQYTLLCARQCQGKQKRNSANRVKKFHSVTIILYRKVSKTEDQVIERAKANASLWEARLEVTELSRIEYRDTSRRLAKNNEDLKKQQYKLEKDTMSVLSYLKKQDQEKDNMVGRKLNLTTFL